MADEQEPQTNATTASVAHASLSTNARGATSARGTDALTDLHGTKVPADDPRLKLERPRSRTLRRGPALLVAGLVATVFGVALMVALTPSTPAADDPKKTGDTEGNTSTDVTLPDMLRQPAEVPTRPATTGPGSSRTLTDASNGQLRDDPAMNSNGQRTDAVRQARTEELARARGASLFAQADDSAGPDTAPPSPRPGASGEPSADERRAADGPPSTNDPSRPADPNMQHRKNDFVARAGISSAEYLDKSMTEPRSPYELKAGTVIPTVLVTGINSDLPGQVVGQVRENVYDTVTGNYLLIPQGSRMIAAYDSMVAWGQERVLVCWNRVIRPDGTSITLDCMPGVDLAGYAGFSDEVNNHWWRIISGAAFSSLLAATAQRSQGDVTTYQPSLAQSWAGNAAGQINQAGQQITARNLQMQPTITVRPGFSVNVIVSKDIILPPYRRQ